jgi:4-amino-4-deoxy-L-arabinose transferase-like glycosyltransferase
VTTVWRRVVLLSGLIVLTAAYAADLGRVPAALGGDEVEFANHAWSLARTGADLNGRVLPLFIQISDPRTPDTSRPYWYQPVVFYLIALFIKILPFAEWSVRLPVALIGVLNIALIYLVGRRLFSRPEYALVAAGLIAFAPAHFIMSRQALDYLCPLPFVLAWLWCLLRYLDGRRPSLAVVGAVLGVGTFSYVAAWALTPIFLALSIAAVWSRGDRWPAVARLCGGFAAPIALAVPWLLRHPEPILHNLARYRDNGPAVDLLHRVSLYWDYFSPSFLFFAGGTDPTQTTSRAGVWPLPVAVFLIVGLIALLRQRGVVAWLLLAGLALAPLPVVLVLPPNPEYSIARALLLLPFGSLIAAHGAAAMFGHRLAAVRIAAIALVVFIPLQFASFARDYFVDYAARSVDRFDNTHSRELGARLLKLIDSTPTPAIYLDGNTGGRAARWLFFVNAHNRPELWDRTFYVDPARPDAVPPGSLLVVERPEGPVIMRRTDAQTWSPP